MKYALKSLFTIFNEEVPLIFFSGAFFLLTEEGTFFGVLSIQNRPDRNGIVFCRGNPLWLPCPQHSKTIRMDSRTFRNDERQTVLS